MASVEMCNVTVNGLWINVTARIEDGALTIEGQDLGPAAESSFGDTDYEYWYRFDREATADLKRSLSGKADFEDERLLYILQHRFRGPRGCEMLCAFCDAHGVKYEFSSYA